jgi:exopolyphosphatase/guanosine-5'-triphosphate,3'-diphosphate pyrophosphatase
MEHRKHRPVGTLVDLGTNSVRLVIVRLEEDGSHVIIKQEKIPVNLGDGSFENHLLTEKAMDRTFEALKSMVETARFFGADYIKAVATSALRQADNRDIFLKRVFQELGLDLKVIPGLEEARLIYRGVSKNLGDSAEPSLIMDIGGGSVELIVKGPKSYLVLDSLPLGAARVADLFRVNNHSGRVSKDLYQAISQYVVDRTQIFIAKASSYKLKVCHGCAGVLENLAHVESRRQGRTEKLQKFPTIAAKDLQDLGLWLGDMTLEERKKVKGLDREKVPIIVAGCAIVDAILKALGIQILEVVDFGLKHGLVYDFVEHYFPNGAPKTREDSIRQLGRRCLFDEEHGQTVAELSLLIYDAMTRAGIIEIRPTERELLYLGALVHDIGKFLAYENHQLHSWYLVKNATVLGFDEDEIDLMAFLALSHRGGRRQKYAEIYDLYEKSERLDYGQFKALGLVLAMAEILESRRQGAVKDFEVELEDRRADFIISVNKNSDIDHEISLLNKINKKFNNALDCSIGEVTVKEYRQ